MLKKRDPYAPPHVNNPNHKYCLKFYAKHEEIALFLERLNERGDRKYAVMGNMLIGDVTDDVDDELNVD